MSTLVLHYGFERFVPDAEVARQPWQTESAPLPLSEAAVYHTGC